MEMAAPSWVEVPRPISSSITSERGVLSLVITCPVGTGRSSPASGLAATPPPPLMGRKEYKDLLGLLALMGRKEYKDLLDLLDPLVLMGRKEYKDLLDLLRP